jgi:formylglycine-generating enzyme required for sulfatase activity
MSERMQKRELYAAIAGIALLAFAMAYRWLLPWAERIDWWSPADDTAEIAATQRVERLAAEAEAARIAPAPEAAVEEEPEPSTGEHLDDAQRAQLAEWINAADEAVKERRWLSPEDDNALKWYSAVLGVDPRHSKARIGRTAVLDSLFAQANAQLDDSDTKLADDVLATLDLHQIRDPRANELALRITRLAEVRKRLQEASALLAAGAVVEPADASAVHAFREAQALDPSNRAAAKGLIDIENQILGEALKAASEQRFADADAALARGLSVASQSPERASFEERIRVLKQRAAEDFVLRAEAALAAGDLASGATLLEQARTLGAESTRVAAIEQRRANAALYASYQPGDQFSDAFRDRSGEGPPLVVVPVGEFQMGSADTESGRSPSESPLHRVRISRPFALGRHEVSVAEFRRFVAESSYVSDAERKGGSSTYDERTGRIVQRKSVTWQNDFQGGRAKSGDPVVHVSWNDAAAYVQWLTQTTGKRYRLPTEAEFEFSLRAGTTTRYWWGDGNPPRIIGNLTGDGDRSRSKRSWGKAFPHYRDGYWGPAPIGRFEANGFGLYDMGSNVSEWVEDCWHQNYLRAPEDGSAWVNRGCAKRVVRGGSWGSEPDHARAAYRLGVGIENTSARVGFRVARDL